MGRKESNKQKTNKIKIQNNSILVTELFTAAIYALVGIKSSFSAKYGYVREIWIAVREKSGKCQGILFCPVCMNPDISDIMDHFGTNSCMNSFIKP